jgi:hypothetical protein
VSSQYFAAASSGGRPASYVAVITARCQASTSRGDLREEALLRAEVVDQHPAAGADRLGDAAQAGVADAGAGEVIDGRVEEPLAG